MLESAVFLIVLAFILEYVDATLGMGFGTILSPILLIIGYLPIEFVPVLLFSQFVAGLLCSVFHHKFENVNLLESGIEQSSFRILVITGMAGVILSTFTIIALSALFVKIYIALVVSAMGILMLANWGRHMTYSRRRLLLVGSIAAFNKGISGGGYGPMTVSGQILSDIPPRAAVAITGFVEGLICIVGFLLHFVITGITNVFLLVTITIGAALAAPLSAFTTAKLEQYHVRSLVAVSTLIVGLLTLLWVLLTMGT